MARRGARSVLFAGLMVTAEGRSSSIQCPFRRSVCVLTTRLKRHLVLLLATARAGSPAWRRPGRTMRRPPSSWRRYPAPMPRDRRSPASTGQPHFPASPSSRRTALGASWRMAGAFSMSGRRGDHRRGQARAYRRRRHRLAGRLLPPRHRLAGGGRSAAARFTPTAGSATDRDDVVEQVPFRLPVETPRRLPALQVELSQSPSSCRREGPGPSSAPS